MKKLLVICVSLLVATASLFAAGGKEREMTIFGGYQGNFYNYENVLLNFDGVQILTDGQESYQGVALGFEMREMSGDMIGSNVSLALNIPLSVALKYETLRTKVPLDRDDFESLFGIELFAGLLIRPIRTNKIALNITPGIHMGLVVPKITENSTMYLSYGLGADVSVDFALTKNIFMTAGVTASFDLLPITQGIKDAKIFAVTPKLGVGFQI